MSGLISWDINILKRVSACLLLLFLNLLSSPTNSLQAHWHPLRHQNKDPSCQKQWHCRGGGNFKHVQNISTDRLCRSSLDRSYWSRSSACEDYWTQNWLLGVFMFLSLTLRLLELPACSLLVFTVWRKRLMSETKNTPTWELSLRLQHKLKTSSYRKLLQLFEVWFEHHLLSWRGGGVVIVHPHTSNNHNDHSRLISEPIRWEINSGEQADCCCSIIHRYWRFCVFVYMYTNSDH